MICFQSENIRKLFLLQLSILFSKSYLKKNFCYTVLNTCFLGKHKHSDRFG